MAIKSRTRILIVDDSAVMRSLLRGVVNTDASLEVAGTSSDGESALHAIETLRPDLILLDLEMPVMDGLVTLRKLREREQSVPVIMCSSLTQRGARVTIEALASGAADYVAKPAGQAGRDVAVHALAQELIPKIKALTFASPKAHLLPGSASSPAALIRTLYRAGGTMPAEPPKVVVIGVSTGGPAALDVVLPALPHSFPLPVLVVQHMPELFTGLLAEHLNGRCNLRVREAVEDDPVRPGTITIARGNWHMEVRVPAQSNRLPVLHLHQGPQENHCRPAVDVLFRSAAMVYEAGVLAVVLTGMGSDGLAGCRTLRAAGGTVLVQDQASSAVWGMPGVVAATGLAHRIVPLDAMAREIVHLAAPCATQALQGSVA